MSHPPVAFYEFDAFRIDMQRYLLMRAGEAIQLSPKALRTLLVLIENRERVVRKDELLEIIWPDSHVEESNLAQNIFVIRKALSEGKAQRYIVTIPGTGYRFASPVTEILAPGVEPFQSISKGFGEPGREGGATLIAVLPLKSLSNSEPDDYLGLGLADALITRLSGLKQIKVRPTSSVLRYREMIHDLATVGRDLNVEALLDGVFQRAGNQIRVSMQLVRVSDGVTLWATKFDEQFTNIFSIQDSISEQVASALALELSGEEQRQLRKNYTGSTDAFQLYIKGRYFWNQRTLDGLRKCMAYAEQAIALDPTYAPAYIQIADSYNLLAGHGGLAPKETFPKAKTASMRALEIDPTLAEAYCSLGFVNYRFEWNWRAAEQNFQKAIQLKPNYSTAHHWYGEALATVGRFAESVSALEHSQQIDPLSLPIHTDLAQTLFFARRYRECEDQLRKTLEMDPQFIRAHIILGAALEQMGRFDEAITSLTRAVELSKSNSFAMSGLGHAYAAAGNEKAARETLRYLKDLSRKQYCSAYNMAIVLAGLGENESALDLLEQAVADRDVWLVWLKINPRLDVLRSEVRFGELLRQVGATAEA